MIIQAFQISLIIVAIHALFWKGMLFFPLVGFFERINLTKFVKKPLFECMICMSSLWTIIFCYLTDNINIHLPALMLTVCGINVILDSLIYKLRHHDI